jgi:hypothetical protein
MTRKKIREQYRKDYDAYKVTLRCSVCGDGRWYVLDHHHRNPTEKKFEITSMRGVYPIATIMREVAKCIVLCSNCHRELHYLESV